MRRRRLGGSGPEIGVVGFGAWEAGGDAWGPNESDERVIEAIRAGLDAGMTWVDTAEVYGPHRSEELVGRAVAGRRDGVRVFTKVAPTPAGSGFRPEQVRAALRASLRRLRRSEVDLYQLHWPDSSGVPLEETWGAMGELQAEGLTRWIGVSNFGRDEIARCVAVRHVDSVQNELSLVVPGDRAELLPWLATRGVGYLAYSPLGAGILTGALSERDPFRAGDWRRAGPGGGHEEPKFRRDELAKHLAGVERLRAVAARTGVPVASLALGWVLAQPGVTAAIAGSRDPAHARSNAAAATVELDPATLAEIDAIFGLTAG